MKNGFFRSFRYAAAGIVKAFLGRRNFKVMTGCFALVVALGFLLNVSAMEWALLLICSCAVLSLEILNTAIEKSIDLIVSEYRKTAGDAKDLAAGASLTASVFSAVVAGIIFIPHIVVMLKN